MQEQTRWLDLRFLIGWMFTIYGVVLAGYGLVANPQVEVMKGYNLNLIWGAATLLFGLVFLASSFRKPIKKEKRAQPKSNVSA
jgi:hypothetical protein